ncbi:glycosyl transferase family 39 [Thermovibrio ammonificans HB-1]|uniref:Glycosyl transferase family 39 n=1 Tax=Thermovibrio ammonificans (strain DSM 15698 / JCM 12110 / HB-1) TaxID=648996 RepID=E8T3C1_THEA1|nr:glycosyltransferase family 39 protein [Thermovibrio ammonificans]ADU97253.1 glycosyl transferase family 39 [Thermovibrio ammonificans HB-1]
MLKDKRFWFVVLLAFVLLVLPGGLYTAFDKDEPKYLEAAWEMVKRGDYITPYYNYQYRFDKPVLIYWLIVAGYKLFGVGEFGGRFFVSLFGVFTVALLYWWLNRWKGREFAFWGSLVLLSLLDFIVMSSVAMPDIVLTFFISAALIFFFEGYKRRSNLFYNLAFVAAGFATLTKGPVGLVLPGLVAVIFLALRRELISTLKGIPWLSGFLLYFAVVLPWYAAIFVKHGRQFFMDFIVFHNIHRFTGKIPGHPTQWWYYFANYFWLYLPWSLFFPFALYKLYRQREHLGDDVLEYSLVWFFTVFAFFQIAHTKLAHYLLPSFPAFAVIVTWYLLRFRDRLPVYLTAALFLLLAVVGVAFWLYKGWPVVGLLFVAPPLIGALWALWSKEALRPITYGFLAGMLLFKWITLPSLQPLRAKPAVGDELRSIVEKCRECRVVFLSYTSPEIVYRFREGPIPDLGVGKVKKLLSLRKPVVVVTRENRLKRLEGVKYHVLFRRKELLTNHTLVVISNYSKERLDGGD